MRLGVDVGGTKIEVVVLEAGGAERLRRRIATPQREYGAALATLAEHILAAEMEAGGRCSVGIGMPGLVSPDTGIVANAYNTPYNGKPLKQDLEKKLGREVRFANDANCFALSEAVDGAARGAGVVFGAILGTGVGGCIEQFLSGPAFVVGGGVSKHGRLFTNVPPLLRKYVYCEDPRTPIVRAMHGDASGVRGAAMLWPLESPC